jgi:hypothetical protein
MTGFIENIRKSNLKNWICPIDGKTINSRGAPAYLRNKYNIPWNQKFLKEPSLLLEGIEDDYKFEPLYRMRALFLVEGIEDTALNRKAQRVFYRLLIKLRFAMYCKKHESISRVINRIQSIIGPVK